MNAFEKIQVGKKYLLGTMFPHKSSLKNYLDSHQSRLEELFKETSVLSEYLGEQFKGFQFKWFSAQRQLRDFMKIPYPCKEIEVQGRDEIYADYFKANIVQERVQVNPEDAKFIDLVKDPFTKYLTIQSSYDFNGGVAHEIAYFLRKCTQLERLTLRITDIRLRSNENQCEFDVKSALQATSSNIQKLDVKYYGQYQSPVSNLVEEQIYDVLQNIVTNSKDVLDTLAIDIRSSTTYKKYGTMFEVSTTLLRILKPVQNKLKKVLLRADQLDNHLANLLQNELHFPCLKSVTINCQHIEDNTKAINILIGLVTKNKRPKRPIQKFSFTRMTNYSVTNDKIKTKVLAQTHSAIQYLKLSDAFFSMEDCEKILSGSNKPVGFTLEVVRNDYSAEQVSYLAQKFPQICFVL
ncbi:hypothetical protein FGO68_gene16732 [Halteria grandinella]|uniref:Uncharacterized protein n=1 Tax=Halteria grandinella TaxID=5974 RepID=A0A8J8T581_HALGN|nr:hypothetical protein FGO68_gene16732 [Halteria grandinella]